MGWSVLPAFQGRGIATKATKLALASARAAEGPRFVHASPDVDNAPSNAICRKVGFELLGAYDAEYPPGTPRRLNDWRFDLRPEEGPPPAR
jgi:RimJ/RimL family protein N-acetyltransferase